MYSSETQEKYPARWNNTEDQILSNTHREKIEKKNCNWWFVGAGYCFFDLMSCCAASLGNYWLFGTAHTSQNSSTLIYIYYVSFAESNVTWPRYGGFETISSRSVWSISKATNTNIQPGLKFMTAIRPWLLWLQIFLVVMFGRVRYWLPNTWLFFTSARLEIRRRNTRVGTLIVATAVQLIQNRYMLRRFTLLQCSHQHCLQPVAIDVEVVGYL